MNIVNILNKNIINKYIIEIKVTEDWVSYRNPNFPINSASLSGNRFNRDGQIAYYLANDDETARRNVSNLVSKIKCKVAPHIINSFDLPSFSEDYGMGNDFLRSKNEGGYPLCQETADFLLFEHQVTGILYTSYPDFLAGMTGLCMVIRPQDGRLVNEAFFFTGVSV